MSYKNRVLFFIYSVYSACYCNRSRGFGFITYSNVEMVNRALYNVPHVIDSRQVDPKRATPREVCEFMQIIFIFIFLESTSLAKRNVLL